MFLILEADVDLPVAVEDVLPRVEQVNDPVLDAAQAFLAFELVSQRLRVDPVLERVEKAALDLRAHVVDLLSPPWRRQPRLGVAGQSDECAREAAVERPGGERRHAPDLDRPVERLVIVTETLVVGAVTRLMDVQQGDDKARPAFVASDPAGRLDVLGVRLGLAEHDHQPEPGDIQTDRDHVGRDRAVHALPLVEGALQAAARLRDLVRRDARGQLHHLRECLAVLEEAAPLTDAPTLPVPPGGILNFLFEDPAGAAELAQAVEVAEHGHVRVGGVHLVSVPARVAVGLLGRAHQRKPHPAHHRLRVPARAGNTEIQTPGRRLRRLRLGEEGVPPAWAGRREHLGVRPPEQRLDLILRPAYRRGGRDDLRPHRVPVDLSYAQGFDRGFVEADHRPKRP